MRKNDIQGFERLLQKKSPNTFEERHSILYHSVSENKPEFTQLLFDYGADPNIDDTPLIVAVLSENEDLIRLFMKNNANPYQPDPDGQTSLDFYKLIKPNQTILSLLTL